MAQYTIELFCVSLCNLQYNVPQVADPFYVFQFCSIILWSFDEYYYYAVAILIVSLVSIIITVNQTRKVSAFCESSP